MVYHVSFAEVVLLMFLIKVSLPFPPLRAIYVDCKNKNYFAINKIIG